MALARAISRRFLDAAKICTGQIRSDGGDRSVLRRMLPDSGNRLIQSRPIFQVAVPPERMPMPMGEKLVWGFEGDERLRRGISDEDVRKVLKATQMELVRSRLRAMPRSCVGFSEFLGICCEVSNGEQGPEIARCLDESAAVIVIGNVVFVRPDQVAKAIEQAIPLSLSPVHSQREEEELKKLEQQKAAIDNLAVAKTRKELWCSLAFLSASTAGFMRLTFWELSWDVMEPICFYVTSFYFMAGYFFFMKTSTEPSFEGFFKTRFASKQKKLIESKKFDLSRFNELNAICRRRPTQMPPEGGAASCFVH